MRQTPSHALHLHPSPGQRLCWLTLLHFSTTERNRESLKGGVGGVGGKAQQCVVDEERGRRVCQQSKRSVDLLFELAALFVHQSWLRPCTCSCFQMTLLCWWCHFLIYGSHIKQLLAVVGLPDVTKTNVFVCVCLGMNKQSECLHRGTDF